MMLVLVDTCTLLSNLTPESLTNHPPLRGFATPSSNIPGLRAVCGVISAFHTQQHWWPQKEMYQQALYLIGLNLTSFSLHRCQESLASEEVRSHTISQNHLPCRS